MQAGLTSAEIERTDAFTSIRRFKKITFFFEKPTVIKANNMHQITTIILFCLVALALHVQGQNTAVAIYKALLLKNNYAPIYEELHLENHLATYRLVKKEKPESMAVNETTGAVSLFKALPDSLHPFLHIDLLNRKIKSRVFLSYDNDESFVEYCIAEPFSIQWSFHPETKKIGKYVCKKATASFRGRSYTAWFTEAVPLNVGPWKFQGLPGLLVEIYDNKREVAFTLEKIEMPANKRKLLPIWCEAPITFNKYWEFRKISEDRSSELMVAKLLAKLPRGASIDVKAGEITDIEKEP